MDELYKTAKTPDALIPLNDKERLAALYRYDILDTPPEAFFDKITKLITKLLKVSSAFVSLVDKDQVWYKSNLSSLEVASVSREDSLCSLTIISDEEVTVFEDTHLVQSLLQSPYVSAPGGIRFYAGAPLVTHDGYHIGTVCAVDSEPHGITQEEKEVLVSLASLVVEQIELRAMARKAVHRHDELYSNLAFRVAEPLKEQQILLEEAEKSPKSINIIRKAHATSTRLQENLQALLAASLQEEEELVPRFNMVAVWEVASMVAKEYESLAQAKDQELIFTVASRRELLVDLELLREAIGYLVSTAIKYTSRGSSVWLDIYESEGLFRIEVSTEASTLMHDDLKIIFLKYARLSGKATGEEHSTGVELAKAKKIIEVHHGMVWAEHIGRENGNKFVIALKIDQ